MKMTDSLTTEYSEPSRDLDILIGRTIIGGMVFLDNDDDEYVIINPIRKIKGILPYYSTEEKDTEQLTNFLSHKGVLTMVKLNTEVDYPFKSWMEYKDYKTEPKYTGTLSFGVCLSSLELYKKFGTFGR